MAELGDFDDYMVRETDKYLKDINKNRGVATTNRQVGQRKRRLREALYKLASISTGLLSFTTTAESLKDAGISAAIEQANIKDSVGQELERYGAPPGGELIDDTDYEDEMGDETLENYVLKPKTASIFGDKDGFGSWLNDVYLESRPLLRDMVNKQYWKVKDGSYHFGEERSVSDKAKAMKFISWKLRDRISKNGIRPNSVIISNSTTILNYESGSHTLNKGRI